MTRLKDPTPLAGKAASLARDGKSDAAFDLWLHRGLHELFDTIAQEPIPAELLRLIEAHRPT